VSEMGNPYAAPEAPRAGSVRPARLRRPEEFSTPFRLFVWMLVGGAAAIVIAVVLIMGVVGTLALASAQQAQSEQSSPGQTPEQQHADEQRRQRELQEQMQVRMQEHLGAFMAGGLLYMAGAGALIAALVFQMILLYRAWEVVQDGRARTTPGRAVGFLFIPIFNLYWFFVAKFGLAKDLNGFIDRHAITARRVSPALGLGCAILLLACIIPFVGLFALIPAFVVLAIFLKQVTDACCDIVTHQAEEGAAGVQPA
jgi:hypothetical protein